MQPRDSQAEKILADGKNNPAIPGDLPQRCLKAAFESSKTYSLFTAYFDDELYNKAAAYYDNNTFGRERPMYAILGITRVLEDVEISQSNRPLYRDMQRFLEQDFTTIRKDKINMLSKFQAYLTARIDIKLLTATGDFQIKSVSDEKATVRKPNWFQKDGIGYQLNSYAGQLNFIAKATVDEKILLALKGVDVRNPEDKSKRIPYWIDYTKLTVNGKIIFDTLTPAWHDKPYIYKMSVKANEEIEIQVEWLPHRSDT